MDGYRWDRVAYWLAGVAAALNLAAWSFHAPRPLIVVSAIAFFFFVSIASLLSVPSSVKEELARLPSPMLAIESKKDDENAR